MKIEIANFHNGDTLVPITASALNKKLYESMYRKKLFCREKDCKTLLSFVERTDTDSKFFKTWPKKVHILGCKNEVSYVDTENISSDENGNKYKISDKQIIDKLKRAYNSLNNPPNHFPGNSINTTKNSDINTGNMSESGRGTLFEDGKENLSGRAPHIYTKNFDTLDDSDVREVRCVMGRVRSMSVFNEHAYINLTQKKQGSVKIYFSEYFIANNKAQFNQFSALKRYVDFKRDLKEEIICCCVGEVRKVSTGYNVHPSKYICFSLNGLGYYDILADLNNIVRDKVI